MLKKLAEIIIPLTLNAKFNRITLFKGDEGKGKVVIRRIKREDQQKLWRFLKTPNLLLKIANANYLVIIYGGVENEAYDVRKIQKKLDLAFMVIYGISLNDGYLIKNPDETINAVMSTAPSFSKVNAGFKKSDIALIRNIYERPRTKSIDNLYDILNVAIKASNSEIRLAFLIILLEMLILSVNEKQELAYRLAARMTKKRKKGLDYFNKIKTLYNRRSEILHNGKSSKCSSLEDEVYFAEKEALWFLKEYLLDTESFESKKLDENLFK